MAARVAALVLAPITKGIEGRVRVRIGECGIERGLIEEAVLYVVLLFEGVSKWPPLVVLQP